MNSIIYGHYKTGTLFSQPIPELFLILNILIHNLLLKLCAQKIVRKQEKGGVLLYNETDLYKLGPTEKYLPQLSRENTRTKNPHQSLLWKHTMKRQCSF